MSSSPVAIRRAEASHGHKQDGLTSTPGGKHFYGSTPGGTRIVYSREQLLSLASSPLSQTSMRLPQEISRSPEKGGIQPQVNGHSARINPSPPSKAGMRNGALPLSFNQKATNGMQAARSPTSNGAGVLARSPPSAGSFGSHGKPRSPGNAFNFAKGPVSPAAQTNTSSFKERMDAAEAAAAKQQDHRGNGDKRGEAEDPFTMEM